MDKIKVFFDTNVYDELIVLSKEEWLLIKNCCELYTCDVVDKELMAIPDKKLEKRGIINQLKNSTKFDNVKVFGTCSYDNRNPSNITGFKTYKNSNKEGRCFNYEDGTYYNNVKKFLDNAKKKPKAKNNNNDAFIAMLANKEKCILVTHDGTHNQIPQPNPRKHGLYQATADANGCRVMTLRELIMYLNSKFKPEITAE